MEDTPHTPKKRYNLRKRSKKKQIASSDSEPSDDDDSDYIPGCSDDEMGASEEEFNIREWQRFVGKLFPSRATNQRLRKLDELDKYKSKPRSKTREKKEVEEDEGYETDASEDITEDSEYIDEDLLDELQNGNMKVNVIFTVAENPDAEYYGDDEDLYYEDLDESEPEEEPKKKKKKTKKTKKTKKGKQKG